MKKSQLRNIIRESIKKLMTEQIGQPGSPGSIPTTFYAGMVPCGTPTTLSNQGILAPPTTAQFNAGFSGCIDLGTTSPSVGDVFTATSYPHAWLASNFAVGDKFILTSFGSTLSTPHQCYNHQGPNFTYYVATAIPNSGGCPPLCDTTPASACAQQWFGNTAGNFTAWMASKDCSNYQSVVNQLEPQAVTIMAGSSTPQSGPYGDWNAIKNAANASGLTGTLKGQFKRKMAKAMYAQCQIQACSC